MITSEMDNEIKCFLCIEQFLCLAFESSNGAPYMFVCISQGTDQDDRAHCGRLTKTTTSQAKTSSTSRETLSQG